MDNIISTTDMMIKLFLEPENHAIMLIKRGVSRDINRINRLKATYHIIPVKYKNKNYEGMVPNYYKERPIALKKNFELKFNETKDNMHHAETNIYERVIPFGKDALIMLFSPKISSKLKNYIKSLHLTEVVRYEGKLRSGVVCVHPQKNLMDVPQEEGSDNKFKVFGINPKE